MASFKANFLYNIILNLANMLFPLVTAPYVARVLEPDGVGLFHFSGIYAGYFALVAILGLPTYGIREIARVRSNPEEMKRTVSELMSISFFSTVLLTVIYILSIVFVDRFNENLTIFMVAGITLYLAPLKIDWFYRGIESFGYITARSLIVKTISIIALFLFVQDKSDLLIYVLINALYLVAGDIWNYLKLITSGIRPHIVTKGLRRHFGPVFILLTASLGMSIYTVLDTMLLGFLSDYDQIGFYSNATHMTKAVIAIVTSLGMVAIPRISQYMSEGRKEDVDQLVDRSVSVISFMVFPAAIGLACISSEFVPLFFGDKFEGTVIPLCILSFNLIATGMSNLAGTQILIGIGKDKYLLYAVLGGAIASITVNYLLIPRYGAIGASIASLSAEVLVLTLTVWFVRRFTSVRFRFNMDITKAALASMLFIPLSYATHSLFSGWIFVGAYIVSATILYMALQYAMRNTAIELVRYSVRRKFLGGK